MIFKNCRKLFQKNHDNIFYKATTSYINAFPDEFHKICK